MRLSVRTSWVLLSAICGSVAVVACGDSGGTAAGMGTDSAGSGDREGGAAGSEAGAGKAGSAPLGGSHNVAGNSADAGATDQAGASLGGDGPVGEAGMPGSGGTGGDAGEAGQGSVAEGGAGGDGPAPQSCKDADGDGYGTGNGCLGPDCNDRDFLINPSMLELADDTKDNDCAGGDLTAAVGPGYYVNGNDPKCSDAQGAPGTKLEPYCSIAIAMVYAYQATEISDPVGRSLFVAKGTYPVTTGTPKSMRVYGGYDASNWSYDPAKNLTTLGGDDAMKDADGYAIGNSWLSVNVKANAVIQGFHITGGKKPNEPIFAVEINSSGKVELYDNTIVAGEGYQTLAVSIKSETKGDPTTSNAWLIKNRISAGIADTSSNYGVNNLGTAVLWGNVVDMGQGSGTPMSFGAAVQNYGKMKLVDNVLNAGSYGTKVDYSYGFINATADGLPGPGNAVAIHNAFFGGRGTLNSVGVRNDAELTLSRNLIADRSPGPLSLADAPKDYAAALTSGFAAATTAEDNVLFQLFYSDELDPPTPQGNRHLFVYFDNDTHPVESVVTLDGCAWTGCGAGTAGNSAENGLIRTAPYLIP